MCFLQITFSNYSTQTNLISRGIPCRYRLPGLAHLGLAIHIPILALRSFLVGITRTTALNIAALTAVLVNIPGNWIFIFDLDLGIAGAAIASSFAELCSLAVLSIYVLRGRNRRTYGLFLQFDKQVLLHVYRVSVWSMFHSFISVAPWFLFLWRLNIWVNCNWR